MKASIHLWAGAGESQLAILGYTPAQEINANEVFSIANMIFDVGLNVMITHGDDHTYIWVDNRRFQQR